MNKQHDIADLSNAEWLGFLVKREIASRNTRRFQTRTRSAKLRHIGAAIEDVDFRTRAGWTGPDSSNSPPGVGSTTPAT